MSPLAVPCVLCGFDAAPAPRVHLRDLPPEQTPREVGLGLCETHGARLQNGELSVLLVVETWLTAEGRHNPVNPLHEVRLIAHCLACDAPLNLGDGGAGAKRSRTLPTGELVVQCEDCPSLNIVETIGGDPAAVRLWSR